MPVYRVKITRVSTVEETGFLMIEAATRHAARATAENADDPDDMIETSRKVRDWRCEIMRERAPAPADDDDGAEAEARMQHGMAFGCEPPERGPNDPS